MSNSLIPRVKINYTLSDILKSLVVDETRITKREECKRILSTFFDNQFICLVPSSRNAIYELLVRLPQNKVIIPAYTCMVVNEAVQLSGKEILFSKTDISDFNSSYLELIDRDSVVIATHQYGLPCNIEDITEEMLSDGVEDFICENSEEGIRESFSELMNNREKLLSAKKSLESYKGSNDISVAKIAELMG